MKKNSNAKVFRYDLYDIEDFNYYGVFLGRDNDNTMYYGYRSNVKMIDPKRLRNECYEITDEMFKKMSIRNTQYFYPRFPIANAYVINNIRSLLKQIHSDWKYEFKGMLRVLEKSDKFYNECISDIVATPNMTDIERRSHCERLMNELDENNRIVLVSVYAQYILYLNSVLDAKIRDVFMERKYYISRHFRKDLYSFYEKKKGNFIKDDGIYKFHDKFMTLHKFIKHTSEKNYDLLKNNYSDLLVEKHQAMFNESGVSVNLLKLNDEVLGNSINELIEFFENYCLVVFSEDIEESKWNHGEYFFNLIDNRIDMLVDPMGLDPWSSW